jgi:protoporphyrin/coproporphyrin ferrochelatase
MPVGVLVMAHGTPATAEGIEPFYTRIRRGRPPTPEQLADLRRRYQAIGGTSPLAARTAAQVAGLAARLERAEPGRYTVGFGAKHTVPSIEEAAAALVKAGAEPVVGLVLTPHASASGSGEYLGRAAAAAGPAFVGVARWYDAPGFADLLAQRVRGALADLPAGVARPIVLFTAHSVPRRVAGSYPDELAESAAAVAAAAGLGPDWRVAWQSAGRTPEPWVGPDVLDVLRSLPGQGFDAALVCPIGFVADHLEVLYDLDVEARQVAEGAGLAFARTASLNDDPAFLDVLAGVVHSAAGPGG